MIEGKTVLGIIPARGGSKGVPRKNIREIEGKPLIAWTIEAAKGSKYLDRVVLSSEDTDIIQLAETLGCDVPFVRPAELALDETPGIMPVLHALDVLPSYDYVVLLQPTSPLRTTSDIDRCIEACISNQANACVSVSEPAQNPYWMYTVSDQNRLHSLLDPEKEYVRRQELPAVFALNGAVYVAKCDWLRGTKTFVTRDTLAYVMPPERSLDIDTELDLRMVSFLMRR